MIQVAIDDLSMITDPKARAAAEAFITPLKAKHGDKVDSSQTSRAWDSLLMMAQAMEAAKTTEGTAVRDAFEKIGPYVGAGAPYDFSANAARRHHQEPLRDRLREGRQTGHQI